MPVSAWNNLAAGPGEPDWKSLSREFRDCKRTFIPHVPSWEDYQALTQLKWDRIKYDDRSKQPLDRRGVYAFVLCPELFLSSSVPPFGFILYVGETGDNSQATLKSRLKSYRNKRSQKSRARVYSMIDVWEDYLYFYFAEIAVGVSTKQCETSLLDALLPPCNEKDLSAIVSNARKEALT